MQVTVGYDYVLVLEWLAPDDRRTGTELHARLLAVGPSGRLASSFACTPDSVRRDFGPMRHDLADSASTFAEPTTKA
jgi:hypothetical protein